MFRTTLRACTVGWSAILAVAVEATPCLASVTAYYQPTPYPSSVIANCAPQSQGGCGIHVLDGWLPSVYYGQTFQIDDYLRVGGWGDTYATFIQFNIEGLPHTVQSATLMLRNTTDSGSSTSFTLEAARTAWAAGNLTTQLTWASRPTAYDWLADVPVGSANNWWNIPITGRYLGWQNKQNANNGLTLWPDNTNDNFDRWRSSRYTTNDGDRPILALTFNPPVSVPSFKLPLPGNLSWIITTEVGGWDCKGQFDPNHAGHNYFSIDFGWQTKENKYAVSDKIPVTAAADGTVIFAGNSGLNGNFVVLQHSRGGFETRYLHLDRILVAHGQTVRQGDELGYMGNTGETDGGQKHLHFGMRYGSDGTVDGGDGAATSNVQYAIIDGWLLKSIQTECSVDANGNPLKYIRYYKSSNRAY